jgi:hypothetical protein
MIARALREVRSIWLEDRAFAAAARRDYKRAWALIREIYTLRGVRAPSKLVYAETNLAAAAFAVAVGELELSLACASMAAQQLEESHQSLSVAERMYLRYYARYISEMAWGKLGDGYSDGREQFGVTYDDLRIRDVRTSLREKFVIRGPLPSDLTR